MSIESALAAVASGKAVVVESGDGAREGMLVYAAERSTPKLMAFMVRHTCGYVAVAMPESDCDRLNLPPMRVGATSQRRCYAVAVDASEGIGTGISAADRSHTARTLASPGTGPADLRRPGHVALIRTSDRGVLWHRDAAEAAVELTRMAGLRPAAVMSGIVSELEVGAMAKADELRAFAQKHALPTISVSDVADYTRRHHCEIALGACTVLPTSHGIFDAIGFHNIDDPREHLALVVGEMSAAVTRSAPVLVYIHQQCVTGDVFGSRRCDCGAVLGSALECIAAHGRGVLIYLRSTDDCRAGGHGAAGQRDLSAAALMLAKLGVGEVCLLSGRPADVMELAACGVAVIDRIDAPVQQMLHNAHRVSTAGPRGHTRAPAQRVLAVPVLEPTISSSRR